MPCHAQITNTTQHSHALKGGAVGPAGPRQQHSNTQQQRRRWRCQAPTSWTLYGHGPWPCARLDLPSGRRVFGPARSPPAQRAPAAPAAPRATASPPCWGRRRWLPAQVGPRLRRRVGAAWWWGLSRLPPGGRRLPLRSRQNNPSVCARCMRSAASGCSQVYVRAGVQTTSLNVCCSVVKCLATLNSRLAWLGLA